MAYSNRAKVYLGYEDELVTEKHRSLINFTTNKIGGFPDWHEKRNLPAPQCRLCGLRQLLALQLYTPLEHSKYHRTLYIFACVNPNCWNYNESWTCLRIQSLDNETNTATSSEDAKNLTVNTTWLKDANDWGDSLNDNSCESNGNNLLSNSSMSFYHSLQSTVNKDILDEFADLNVNDPNANSPASVESPIGGGAVGKVDSFQASAEIEGEESEVVCIDTPTQPQHDIVSLLKEVIPFPIQTELNKDMRYFFTEIFLSVEEEDFNVEMSQHVQELLLEYQHTNPDSLTTFLPEPSDAKSGTDTEKYEKSIPLHGDEMFHNFISKIQENPGQLLRYSRDNSAPLLLYPINSCIGKCRHCGEDMIFEIQVLPTIIPKLILQPQIEQNFQIEFGTVLVFTCLRSCWASTDLYREEHVVVQAEKL